MGRGVAARWLALGAFALLVACTQLLWLTFAAITERSAHALGVGTGAIGDLAVVNPAMFVLLAIPAGRWMDRRYAHALGAGALVTAGGALVRLVDPASYGCVLAGQLLLSVGQPLVLNATTKIAARHFPREEQSTAIGIASAAQFVGILAAVLSSDPLSTHGLTRLLVVHAVVATLAAVAVLASLRLPVRDEEPASAVAAPASLRRDRLTWTMAGMLFVGFGSYNALATWLDAIMSDFHHPGVAGTLIAVMTVAGIAGAAALPAVAARYDARRSVCLITTGLLAVVTLVATVVHSPVVLGVLLAVLGVFLMGTLPVVLDWSEGHTGPALAGTVTGLLLLAGNLGAVFVVLTVQAVVSSPVAALVVMALWAIPGFAFASRLPRRVEPAAS